MADNNKIEELAILKSLDLLNDDDRSALDSLSKEQREALESEATGFSEVSESILYDFRPVNPKPDLKDKLLGKIRKQEEIRKIESGTAGFLYVKKNEGTWVEVVKGVHVKDLYTDNKRQYSTVLVKMEPGASFPDHKHAEDEECYIIEGDLHMGGKKFTSGDYIRADADSLHEEIYSENGCTLLVMASAKNEMLDSHA